MTTVISYKTPQEFLDNTGEILELKELENNLIIGLCNGFTEKTKACEGCVFINSVKDNLIQASSIKTISKAVVSGATTDEQQIKALADYYLNSHIDLTGVFGEDFYAKSFAKFYGKGEKSIRTMIVHKLTSVNNLPLANGHLEIANYNDIGLIAEWTMSFEEDVDAFPRQNFEQILKSSQTRVVSGDFFKWVDNNKIVSIAAFVRKTKNFGIIGIVYTPGDLRAKGYATSCVQELSGQILQNGFKYCGLFTDKSNPTSNNIYKKIGYYPATEFSDIEFEK